jgi:putative sigma-54 modulation protein
MVRLLITGRQLTVTPGLRQLLETKLDRVGRLLNDDALSAQVVLNRQRHRHLTEITLHARGDHLLTGLGEGTSWPESIAAGVEKVSQQAHKLKGRLGPRRRSARSMRQMDGAAAAPAGRAKSAPAPRISRYPVKPMSIDEAAARLNRTGDAFVVFRNALDDAVLIAYRRKDGRIALIDPDS